jgi:hypothetical protein
MHVLIVIALLVGVAFMIPFVLTDLARALSWHSFHAPPDLEGSDEWGVTADEYTDTARTVVYSTEQQAAGRYPVERMRGDHIPGSSTAIDDLRSPVDVP